MFNPLSLLSKVAVPPWARIALKVLPYVVIAVLAVIVVIRGKELETRQVKLNSEISWRQSIAKATGCPRDGQVIVRQCLDAKMAESRNRRIALEQISREALANKRRADALDLQLAERQAKNAKLYGKAKPKIDELQNRKPGENKLEQDSLTPWGGWGDAVKTPPAQHVHPLFIPIKDATDPSEWKAATMESYMFVIAVYPYESWAELREAYKRKTLMSEAFLNRKAIGGFSFYDEKKRCQVHVIKPSLNVRMNWTLGHEVMHCIYGAWHA